MASGQSRSMRVEREVDKRRAMARIEQPTKRTSPASAKGLVVNHSHMNALVDPSLTESISPRMSLLTEYA